MSGKKSVFSRERNRAAEMKGRVISVAQSRQRLLLLLSACLLCSQQLHGQETAAPRLNDREPLVRVKTELVELQVIVTDKKGRPVTGLKRDDFTLRVGGSPQEIGFFSEVRSPVTAATGRQLSSDRRPGSPAAPQPGLTGTPRRSILLFVDTLHLSIPSLLRVKKSLRRFADEEMTDQDLVGVVSSAKTLGVTGQLTSNRHVLGYAIEELSQSVHAEESLFTPYIAAAVERGDRNAMRVGQLITQIDEGTKGEDQQFLQAWTRSRAIRVLSEATYRRQATLGTLKSALRQMSGLPGRRLLILYSDGFSLMNQFGTIDSADLREVLSEAVRSGVVVYSIDGKGLEPPPLFSAIYANPMVSQDLVGYLTSSEKDVEDGMHALAKDTGGESFLNTNDLHQALEEALTSNREYYMLGFYPPEGQGEGFQQFVLRVADHPEYRIRTQKGYDPVPRVDKRDAEWNSTPEGRFQKAVLSPVPVSDLHLFAWADFVETELDDAQVSLHIHIAGDGVAIEKVGDSYRTRLELMTYVFNKRGKSLESKVHSVEGRLTRQAVDEIRENGLSVSKRLQLKPGLYHLRVGVRDRETEKVGTAVVWVEVPRLPSRQVVLSSVMLGEGTGKEVGLEETRPSGGRYQSGLRFYHPEDRFSYFLVVYPPAKYREEGDLQIRTELLLDGQAVNPAPYRPVGERLLGRDEKGAFLGGEIELAGARPGIYELLVSVKDPKSNRTVRRSAVFGIDE